MADTDQVPGLLLGEKNLTLALLTVAITKAHQPAIFGSSCGDGSRMSSIKRAAQSRCSWGRRENHWVARGLTSQMASSNCSRVVMSSACLSG